MGLALRARRRVRRGAVLLARWRARAGRRLWRARTVDAHCRGCAFAVWERVATGWAVQLADTVAAASRRFHCARALRHWRRGAEAEAAHLARAAGVVGRRTARHYAVARLLLLTLTLTLTLTLALTLALTWKKMVAIRLLSCAP